MIRLNFNLNWNVYFDGNSMGMHKYGKLFKILFKVILIIMGFWVLLTFFVELRGTARSDILGEGEKVVFIVYDPDPFYNLDEQVCYQIGNRFADNGWTARIYTVAAARRAHLDAFDAYVFCSNTYNWAPDWAISNFIRKIDGVDGKPTMAITLGSGSTARSQRLMERLLEEKDVNLITSHSFWLLRPNDEEKMDQPNVEVALDLVDQLTKEFLAEFR